MIIGHRILLLESARLTDMSGTFVLRNAARVTAVGASAREAA
jgi:hypothetical protein